MGLLATCAFRLTRVEALSIDTAPDNVDKQSARRLGKQTVTQ